MNLRSMIVSLTAFILIGIAVVLLSVILRSPVPTPTPMATITLFPTPTPEFDEPFPSDSGVAGVFAASPGLAVQGVQLTNPDGTRFIAKGINLELYRDPGCSIYTTATVNQRALVASSLKSFGVNLARLNYSYSWLNQGTNINGFLDTAQALAAQGIYFMPSDHTFTGQSLNNRANVYPLFKKIIDGVRARGLEQYLVFNPYNEPGGSDNLTWAQWTTAQKDTLDYLRKTAGFSGVVVLDTRSWAADFNLTEMKSVQAYDATLLGSPNVVFTNHWYPNISISNVQNQSNNANQVPVMIGELGQENPGASPTTPQYVRDVIANVLNIGIPKGHNGIVAWIYSWCDVNSMTDWKDGASFPSYATLNAYGRIYLDNYYGKLPDAPAGTLVPTSTAVVPTATLTRTATRAATATRTPTTPPNTPTVNAPPTATPVCDWRITGSVGDAPIYLCVQGIAQP